MQRARWFQIHVSTALFMTVTAGVLMARQLLPIYTVDSVQQYGWPYVYRIFPSCCGMDFNTFCIDVALSLTAVLVVGIALEFSIQRALRCAKTAHQNPKLNA